MVQEQVARARQPEAHARWSTPSTASTSRTGPSTRRSSARGKPTRATTTTRPKPTATTRGNTQTRQVRHMRWEPASGVVEHFFDDEPIPGTQGRSHDAAEAGRAVPDRTSWSPTTRSYLSGFVVEHYQVVLLDAAKASEESMRQKLEEMCAAQVPGDTYRNLVIHPTFSARTFKHILVPVWAADATPTARRSFTCWSTARPGGWRGTTRRASGRSSSWSSGLSLSWC